MRFFTSSLIPIACIVLLSCGDRSSSFKETVDTTETDTTNYALNEDSVKMALNNTNVPEGFYQVLLPCADCKGIEHTILFNPDLSYQLQESVMGNEKSFTQLTGEWKPKDGGIWLYNNNTVKAHYIWGGDTLQFVDPKTNVRIPLRHLTSVATNPAWQNKKASGTTFYGIGTEPFWSIEMNAQKNIIFKLADWQQPITFKANNPVTTADSFVYRATNDTALLQVVIYNKFCTDGMSDNVYNNKVKVQYNGQTYNGCGMKF